MDSTLAKPLTAIAGYEQVDHNGRCGDHGVYSGKALKNPSGDIFSTTGCPKCAEKKSEPVAQYIRSPKDSVDYIYARMINSGVSERFIGSTFDNYNDLCDDSAKAKRLCKEYCDSTSADIKSGRSLIMSGKPGTGKTHLAISCAREFVTAGHQVLYTTTAKAIRSVKVTYNKSSAIDEQDAINSLIRPALLIVDEVGVQFGSDAEKMIFFEIIDGRYQAMKPTILISNLSPHEMRDFIGERVIDRMKENGGRYIQFTWESHRGKRD